MSRYFLHMIMNFYPKRIAKVRKVANKTSNSSNVNVIPGLVIRFSVFRANRSFFAIRSEKMSKSLFRTFLKSDLRESLTVSLYGDSVLT